MTYHHTHNITSGMRYETVKFSPKHHYVINTEELGCEFGQLGKKKNCSPVCTVSETWYAVRHLIKQVYEQGTTRE